MSEGSEQIDPATVDPADLESQITAADLWDQAPEPETVPALDFPRSIDKFEWSIHFGQRVIEDRRPPDMVTVHDVLQDGEFRGEINKRDYRFEKMYDGVLIRVVAAVSSGEPIRPELVTAYPIVKRLHEAVPNDYFDDEEIYRSYAGSYFYGTAEFKDGGGVPDDWVEVVFDRPIEVKGHEIVGKRNRRLPRCERCGKRLNYGSAQQVCKAQGDLHGGH